MKMKVDFIIVFIWINLAFSASAASNCSPEESVCSGLCCKPNEYCGGNSLECESCFKLHASEEDNFQTCMEMKNVSDIPLRLRHESCSNACLYTFGPKLFKSPSKTSVANNCSPEESVCTHGLCCKPNEYCGGNSLECESCFVLHASEEDNFQTCMEIKNVSDIPLRLRHESCSNACLYTFGPKLYKSPSKKSTSDSPQLFMGLGIGFVSGLGIAALVVILVYKKFVRPNRSSRSKDEDESGTSASERDQGSVNKTKATSMSRVMKMGSHNQRPNGNIGDGDHDQREILLNYTYQRMSAGENDLQRLVGAQPIQPQTTPGTTGQETTALYPAHAEARQPEPFRREAIEMESIQRNAAQQAVLETTETLGPIPRPGAQQTNFAEQSNGTIVNLILSPTDIDSPAEFVC